MGMCASMPNSPSIDEIKQQQLQQHAQKMKKQPQRPMGIGLGVAMMMQQAAHMSGAQRPQADLANLQNDMRKAKAEGRTVTVINGCVYFDYQLVAQLPPNYECAM
uniref:Uncharacterized protein n=1 Tax=Ditylenchus dipsaci TaxID=166011 RepID=A0A915E494_9BILA